MSLRTHHRFISGFVILGSCLAGLGCDVAVPDGDDEDEVTGTGGTPDDFEIPGGTGGTDFDLTPQPNPTAFPAEPLFDEGIDATQVAAFADPEQFSPGVCVFEPHLSDEKGVGALFPMNWLRPRFRYTGTGAETLWEIRFSAESQEKDLVAYTRGTEWILPQDAWESIAQGIQDDITVTVRGQSPTGVVGMRGSFRVVPVLAGGSMVFWGTSSSVVSPGSSQLYGFTMGDEAVVETLSAEQMTDITGVLTPNGRDYRGESVSSAVTGVAVGAPRCIGCHSATPDGTAMVFTDDFPWNMGIGSIEAGAAGTTPTYVTAGAKELLKMPFLGTGTMLAEPWAAGDRTLIATKGRVTGGGVYIDWVNTFPPELHDLIWIDLATTATVPSAVPAAEAPPATTPWPATYTYSGYTREQAAIARDTAITALSGTAWGVLSTEAGLSISNPVASHKGTQIVYSVSESSLDGHPDWQNNTADIKLLTLTSPQAAAGAAAPVAGASDPSFLEFYPSFSPDDAFLAFNRAPAPSSTTRCAQGKPEAMPCVNDPATLGENPDGPYYNRKGEVTVVPVAGGEPHRLRGNDPVACGGEVSPGVTNSWPKWSSTVREHEGKNYYFIIFSSARAYPGQFNLTGTSYTPPIDTRSSHLYMSVLEQDQATGALVSYAPIYLWNQNYLATGPDSYVELATANLTPAWEDFSIPPVPPVVVVVK